MGSRAQAMAWPRGVALVVLFAALSLMAMEGHSSEITDLGEATSLYGKDNNLGGELGGMSLGEDTEMSAQEQCNCKSVLLELGEDVKDEKEDKKEEAADDQAEENQRDAKRNVKGKEADAVQFKKDLVDAQGVLKGRTEELQKLEAKLAQLVAKRSAAPDTKADDQIAKRIEDASTEAGKARKAQAKAQVEVAAVQVKLNYANKVVSVDKALKDAVDAHAKSMEKLARAKAAESKASQALESAKSAAGRKNGKTAMSDAIKAVAAASKAFDYTLGIKNRKQKEFNELTKSAKQDAKNAQGPKKVDCEKVCDEMRRAKDAQRAKLMKEVKAEAAAAKEQKQQEKIGEKKVETTKKEIERLKEQERKDEANKKQVQQEEETVDIKKAHRDETKAAENLEKTKENEQKAKQAALDIHDKLQQELATL